MKGWRKNKKAVTLVVVMLLILLLLGLQFLTARWIPVKVPKPPCKHKVTSTDVTLTFTGNAAGTVSNVYYSINDGGSWTLLPGSGAGAYEFAVPDYTQVYISATAYADPAGSVTQTVTGNFYIGASATQVPESISATYTDTVIK
jgi:hypothetical protein